MILRKELMILGSWMSYSAPFPGKEWRMAIQALARGSIKVADMITHHFPLQDAAIALDTLRSSSDTIKVMLTNA